MDREHGWFRILIAVALALLIPAAAEGARIKEIAYFHGVRSNSLMGYGLVVGLNGTGDKSKTEFTVNTLANMLDNMGINVDPAQIAVKNVAAVLVTAELPPFARAGTTIDAQVSSIGDAKSLEGGTLLMTPLRGPDGKIYAVARGAVPTGSFAFSGQSGGTVQKNHPTVGYISGGAMVEREHRFDYGQTEDLDLILRQPDFTTASKTARAINQALGGDYAHAMDGATVKLKVPEESRGDVVNVIAMVEKLEVEPDQIAKVVINERTGTIVIGENVRLSPVAVAHGNLTVQIYEQPLVSQPLPFSQGQTVVTPQSNVSVQEGKASLSVLGGGVTIGQVVKGLNAIGASPRDLMVILQAIKRAGALQAEFDTM